MKLHTQFAEVREPRRRLLLQTHFTAYVCALPMLGAALCSPLTCSALIWSGTGNQPVQDAGWPEGALAMANFQSRIGWWEGPPYGGGEWHFLYHGDTGAFKEALASFAAIRAPALDLVIHDGPYEDGILKKRADWTFTVWVPESWHHFFNNPRSVSQASHPSFRQPVAPPRLDVYIGGGAGVDWATVKVPAGLSVRDERVAAAPVSPFGGPALCADLYDMATGKPVTGAQVAIVRKVREGAFTPYEIVAGEVSGASGRVEITSIPMGTYALRIRADGYAARLLDYEHYGERTFRKFTVELAPAASVRGTVTDDGGKPVKDVKVSASNVMAINGRGYALAEASEGVSDTNGVFTLTGLPAGFTQFFIYEPEYYFGDLFTIHDVPGTNIVLRLTRAGGLRITVTDTAGQALSRFKGRPFYIDANPAEESKARLWSGGGTVKDNGTVEFKNMPPGQYRIKIKPNPFDPEREHATTQVITVPPGGPTQVKVIYE